MMLSSDHLRFKQIVLNLISNAIKFTNKGYVELGYLINDKNVPVFYVKDTGIGIEPQYLDHVFNRFWKYEGHNNKLYSGAGLGLAICKKLCGLLGGDIWVESESAKGTTFYFSIPRLFFMKEGSTKSKDIPKDKLQTNWQAFTVAIAEDEEYNLQYLVEALKHTKIKVLCFTNGIEIVHYFENNRKHQVDLVLMDIKMPKMDGFEALQRIKEIDPQLTVIAQTAYAMLSDIKRIKASHFDDFITKPIKAPVLIEKMESFLVKK
jgi:CheY-like chemotaxis protein